MKELLRQGSEPLFPEILWERPQSKKLAKKLLIVGGYSGHVVSAQQCYSSSRQAGIGDSKIVLPDSLRSFLGKSDDLFYVASNRSGTIAKSAISEVLAATNEYDGTLFCNGQSNHPDTTALIESVLLSSAKPVILADEALSHIVNLPTSLLINNKRLLITSTQQLVKLAGSLSLGVEISSTDSLVNKSSLLRQMVDALKQPIVVCGRELLVGGNSNVSVTIFDEAPNVDSVSAYMSVFYLQHTKTFRALTSAASQLRTDLSLPTK